jgi:hypothetical protein
MRTERGEHVPYARGAVDVAVREHDSRAGGEEGGGGASRETGASDSSMTMRSGRSLTTK